MVKKKYSPRHTPGLYPARIRPRGTPLFLHKPNYRPMKHILGLVLILILSLCLAGCISPSSTQGSTPIQTPTPGGRYVTITDTVLATPPPTFIQTSIQTSIPTPIQTSIQTSISIPVQTSIQTPRPTQSPGSQVDGSSVSITELNLQGEYLKITNNGMTPVVMTGWKITNGQGKSFTFIDWPRGDGSTFTFVLSPQSTVTVYYAREGTVTATELYWPTGKGMWSRQGDTAYLYDPQGSLVSSLTA